MKVLWLCNMMLPMIAEQLHREASNKEGWLTGLAEVMLQNKETNGVELAIVFPAAADMTESLDCTVNLQGVDIRCFGLLEDTEHPEIYDEKLEGQLQHILEEVQPDMVHCFGTEFPHTLALCKVFPRKERILITLQGLCTPLANAYFAGLPEKVTKSTTFRDFLKKDNLRSQQQKFVCRGKAEKEAVKLAGNIGGRTPWDRYYAGEWNAKAAYFEMRETLRGDFYETVWNVEQCEPHSIFVSQADYPIKGMHYLLQAMPKILERYSDTKVYVAGNSIVNYSTLFQKIKIGGYGKYLRSLMDHYKIGDRIVFLGKLSGEQMKQRYLKSHLFVCCSSLENSSNSLGEAMLLGMPIVSADVGGLPGIFTGGVDGILYRGFRTAQNSYDRQEAADRGEMLPDADGMAYDRSADCERIADNLANAVIKMWSEKEKISEYCKNARAHALRTHDRADNYLQLCRVYAAICEK